MNSKKILRLKAGDLIDIVSPGSSSRTEDVQKCRELLESWGLRTRLPEETFGTHPFHSQEDSIRLRLLQKALVAKDSQAVWCLRGGYGANRLLPELLKLKKVKSQKMFIGYSDITSLLVFLNQSWSWTVFHGPVLETLISQRLNPKQIEEARRIIFGKKINLQFKLKAMNAKAKTLPPTEASLLGGNLVVLESSLGTPSAPKFQGKICVLEDIGERGYRIDRMLEHLQQAGALKGCRALIFGDFLSGHESDGKNFVTYALQRFAALNSIPCFSGLEMGHGKNNRMLPFGPKAILENRVLKIETGIADF
jgi:muramoyltetrapeptide carboxypeptidase